MSLTPAVTVEVIVFPSSLPLVKDCRGKGADQNPTRAVTSGMKLHYKTCSIKDRLQRTLNTIKVLPFQDQGTDSPVLGACLADGSRLSPSPDLDISLGIVWSGSWPLLWAFCTNGWSMWRGTKMSSFIFEELSRRPTDETSSLKQCCSSLPFPAFLSSS